MSCGKVVIVKRRVHRCVSLGSLMSGSLNDRCLCTMGMELLPGIDRGGSLTLPVHFFGLFFMRRGWGCVGFLSFVNSVGMEIECASSWSTLLRPMVATLPSQSYSVFPGVVSRMRGVW